MMRGLADTAKISAAETTAARAKPQLLPALRFPLFADSSPGFGAISFRVHDTSAEPIRRRMQLGGSRAPPYAAGIGVPRALERPMAGPILLPIPFWFPRRENDP